MVPLLVKSVDSIGTYVSEDIFALSWTTLPTQPLLNHLPALIVQHALMCHLLVAIATVLVHLVALRDSVPSAKGTLSLSLVRLFHRIAILVGLRRCHRLHRSKSTLTHAATTMHHRLWWSPLCHGLLHITAHPADHLVHLTERLFKERVIRKRITTRHQTTTAKHPLHHVVHHLSVPLHDAI